MNNILEKIAGYKQDEKPHTWRTVLNFIQELHFDDDEYFRLFPTKKHMIDQQIWDKQHWIAVFWVIGGSEGYYVHVENRWNDDAGDHADLIVLGKFWEWERAEEATQALQRLINLF